MGNKGYFTPINEVITLLYNWLFAPPCLEEDSFMWCFIRVDTAQQWIQAMWADRHSVESF